MNRTIGILFFLFLLCSCPTVSAQVSGQSEDVKKEKTTNGKDKKEKKVKGDDKNEKSESKKENENVKEEGIKILEKDLAEKESKIKSLEDSIASLNIRYNDVMREKNDLADTLKLKSDKLSDLDSLYKSSKDNYIAQQKRMINYAVNFVFLKFDRYTFDLANQCIKDVDEKSIANANDLKIRADIIRNYDKDCRELLTWLKSTDKKMSVPFREHKDAVEQLKLLQETEVYGRYQNDLWKGTYISNLMKEASDKLEHYQRGTFDFKQIISELENSLNE